MANFSGVTVRDAVREVLIDAEMPLALGVVTERVRQIRSPRLPAGKPTKSTIVARVVEEHPDTFFKFGPFIALQEWDTPQDYARFWDAHRGQGQE
jgi:hypothetical protein